MRTVWTQQLRARKGLEKRQCRALGTPRGNEPGFTLEKATTTQYNPLGGRGQDGERGAPGRYRMQQLQVREGQERPLRVEV